MPPAGSSGAAFRTTKPSVSFQQLKFRLERYVKVNISLIPLAETGVNVSLAVDPFDG
jgi:hypothetical protein